MIVRRLPIFLGAFLLAFAPLCARGAAAETGAADEFADKLEAYSRKLELLPPPAPECRAAYSKVYASDPLTISVFFGFINTIRRNYVADGDFKRALVRRLTESCRGNLQACGFSVAGGSSLANKTVLVKSHEKRKVVINVIDSSVSSDYADCVSRLSGEQELKSRMAEEEYLAALKRDPVVLFSGHTQHGAGPGFHPPLSAVLRRPFFSRIGHALESSASFPAIVGLFSCESREYYAGRMHSLAPGAGLLVSSDLSSHDDSLLSLFGSLELILSRACYDEAERSVNLAKKTPVFRLYGLFDQLPHPGYTRYNNAAHVFIALFFIPVLVILMPRRTTAGPGLPPALGGARGGLAVLVLSAVACAFAVHAFAARGAAALPFLLSLTGLLLSSISAARATNSLRRLSAAAMRALPFLLVFLVIYTSLNVARELSLDNAASALRQSMECLFLFYLLLPFVLSSEDVLLAPYLDGKSGGFVPSLIGSLLFHLVLWLILCALSPVSKPALWPVAVFVLYNRTFSFLLYRRKPDFMIPAMFQAAAWALIITEGIHVLIYR